jgi:hypothetical protein
MSERNYAYINELVPTAQAAVAGDFGDANKEIRLYLEITNTFAKYFF